MSLLEDVQFMNKYNREGAFIKINKMLLIDTKINLYKSLEKGDDPIYLIY